MSEPATTPYTVSAAALDDMERILAFSQDCAEAPHWAATAWRELLAPTGGQGKRNRVFLLRSEAGRLVGWVAGHVLASTAELEFLVIHPQQRSRGLGRVLLNTWLSWAQEVGTAEVLLEVRASNLGAQHLYRKLGFEAVGHRARYYREPVEDALCMRLHLQNGSLSAL